MSPIDEIEQFLSDASDTDEQMGMVVRSLRNLVIERYPEAVEEIKYRGICYFEAGSLVGGIFRSKAHVSFEFSNGADFADPDGLLEGKGKLRRHLKIREMEDIAKKNVTYFLSQAFRE